MTTSVRTDGRTPAMMRQLRTERSLLTRADGSARWEQDRSVVLAAVYGPRTVPARKENTERMIIEVNHRPASGIQTAADKEAEHVIRRTLEQVVLTATHPRLGVTVVLQIVSADGSLESCALNAASAALLDAAVPMRGVLCAATCAHLPDVGPVADPTEDEERDAAAVATHAFCFRGGEMGAAPPAARPEAEAEVLQTTSRGVFASDEDFMTLAVLARDAAASVFRFHREAVERMARGDEEEGEALRRRAEKAAAVARERAGAGDGYRRSFGAIEGGNAETAEAGA